MEVGKSANIRRAAMEEGNRYSRSYCVIFDRKDIKIRFGLYRDYPVFFAKAHDTECSCKVQIDNILEFSGKRFTFVAEKFPFIL